MKTKLDAKTESCRIVNGEAGTCAADGLNGAFIVPGPRGSPLRIIATDGLDPLAQGWEHVSVSVHNRQRCPNWPEMSFVKDLFWDDHEAVIQFHPAKADYVNYHEFTLHMWRPRHVEIVTPPSILVGPKGERA